MPPSLRVVFFGTPQFAVPTLDALLASRHEVVAVVTQPDRPRGRGQRTSDAPVKTRALEAGLPVLQPPSLKDPAAVEALAQLDADLGVVAAYGKILTEAILATPRLGMVNVHASLLPRYRGAAPVHRAVIAGEGETGATIMRVVKALDAGPMLAKITRPIGIEETSADVERDLGLLGAALLVETIDGLAAGRVIEESQDDREATYASRLTRDDGAIDWARPSLAIHNLVRGLHPWPHAFTFLHDRRLILRRSAPPGSSDAVAPAARREAFKIPGTIVQAYGDQLSVATGDGILQLLEIQGEGGRPLQVREFLAGHRLTAGDRFAPRS